MVGEKNASIHRTYINGHSRLILSMRLVGVVGQDISVQGGFLGSGLWVVVRFFVQMGVHSIKFRDHHLRASRLCKP